MSEITNDELMQVIKSIESRVITTQAMIIALAEKTGFSEEDIISQIKDLRPKVMTLDPSPVEVDPEV